MKTLLITLIFISCKGFAQTEPIPNSTDSIQRLHISEELLYASTTIDSIFIIRDNFRKRCTRVSNDLTRSPDNIESTIRMLRKEYVTELRSFLGTQRFGEYISFVQRRIAGRHNYGYILTEQN